MSLDDLHAPHAPLLRAALAELSPRGAGLAVDIGCGPGLKAGWLAECLAPSGRAVGLDLDCGALAAARAAGLWPVAGDAQTLPLRSGCADLCWSVAALALLARPDLALAEARRIVGPGGALVLASAARLWVRLRAWPPALAPEAVPSAPGPGRHRAAPGSGILRDARGGLFAESYPLPPADGLGDDLRAQLRVAGFAALDLRAFLLEPSGLSPLAAQLPLLAWQQLAPLVASALSPTERLAAAEAEKLAEPEPLAVLFVAVARP